MLHFKVFDRQAEKQEKQGHGQGQGRLTVHDKRNELPGQQGKTIAITATHRHQSEVNILLFHISFWLGVLATAAL